MTGMEEDRRLTVIARIHTEFGEKFGIPRQSGLVEGLPARIVFEPPFRGEEWIRGIEEYSHLWLLWDFSQSHRETYPPTVCPPRLGGRVHRGVFATRSPFRPNSIGLSCVRLLRIILEGEDAPVLEVDGADILDGTPVYDIKPYLPYADARPEAAGGFGQEHHGDRIRVEFPESLLERLPEEKRDAALLVLAQDPRAAYNKKPDFVYGMNFAGADIRFRVEEDRLIVLDVVPGGGHKIK